MAVCVLTAGAAALLTVGMPYKLGIVVSAVAGIVSGAMMQRRKQAKKGGAFAMTANEGGWLSG